MSVDIPEGIVSRTVVVNGAPMHYLEAGGGKPILFLHGNPTSSYLWRNVIPHVSRHGRCIAVDLIGMGRSGKPPLAYRLRDHIKCVDAFTDTLALDDLILVLHDWGVTIGLHYLTRFPKRVRGVAFMEGHLHPIESWSQLDSGARAMFQNLRASGIGRRMVIEENFFIETVLPSGILRPLAAEEMRAYRAPYIEPRDREPLWRWPQEIPIEGEPADVHDLVRDYRAYLAGTDIPKLLLHARPGAVIGAPEVVWCEVTLSNLTAVAVGPGIHFLPEDHPDAIGIAIGRWLTTLGYR
ncbi:MAG: haloalkane dehalogenase [Chloroflexota bacterium]|nr:haloalkane dehalogenase [Chloroflexota bacterium]